jgi:hypothetical protein
MGFEGGAGKKILEPAVGIGNFFGLLPEEMRGSELHGVELDSISGRISRQLYQSADIKISGFCIILTLPITAQFIAYQYMHHSLSESAGCENDTEGMKSVALDIPE